MKPRLEEDVALDRAKAVLLHTARKIAGVYAVDSRLTEMDLLLRELVQDAANVEQAERDLEEQLEQEP